MKRLGDLTPFLRDTNLPTFTFGEDDANKHFPSRLVDDRGDLKDELPSSLVPFLRNFSAFLGVAPVGNSFLFSLLSMTAGS